MKNIWVGYDVRVPLQYNVLAHSIVTTASRPISVTPLIIEQVDQVVRDKEMIYEIGAGFKRIGLTCFTYTRFMVPYLNNYEGWSLFMDSDMLVQDDIHKLLALADDRYTVMVVKNKLRFEWASVMLFNNAKCKVLTPEFVTNSKNLHGIGWCKEEEIGELPAEWNHLENVDEPKDKISLIHYTQGVPYWEKTANTPNAVSWHQEASFACSMPEWEDLMGNSVHHKNGVMKKKEEYA